MRRDDSDTGATSGDAAELAAVEAAFAAEAALIAPVRPRAERVSTRDLVRYATDPDAVLSEAQQRALRADPRLAADLAALTARFAVAEIRPAAAASTGPVVERAFEGGAVQLLEAKRRGQFYLKITAERLDAEPSALILSAEDGRTAKRNLMGRLSSGVGTLLLDVARGEDAMLAGLLQDPAARGALV